MPNCAFSFGNSDTDSGMDFLNYFMLSDSGPHFLTSRDYDYENIIGQYLTTQKLDCSFGFNACGWEWFSKS